MINMFNEVAKTSNLCPLGASSSGRPSKTAPTPPGQIDPSKWQEMRAIVDSGATVPVLNPQTAPDYALEESEASRTGVEYEIANGDCIPDLCQKRIAVMTDEGTLRGYTSQCADVSKSLNAVRSMVKSHHAVCFGLGENGDEHLIINKISGEVNRMIDDGVNYIQRLHVIPPDQVEAVQLAMMQQLQESPDNQQPFGGPGS